MNPETYALLFAALLFLIALPHRKGPQTSE